MKECWYCGSIVEMRIDEGISSRIYLKDDGTKIEYVDEIYGEYCTVCGGINYGFSKPIETITTPEPETNRE